MRRASERARSTYTVEFARPNRKRNVVKVQNISPSLSLLSLSVSHLNRAFWD